MARYKHIDTSPRFLAVDLEAQLLPGTLEHALNPCRPTGYEQVHALGSPSGDELGVPRCP